MKQFIAYAFFLSAAFAHASPAKAAPHPQQLLEPLLGASVSTSDRVERQVPIEHRGRIIAEMERHYGAPITRRDGALVWDVENASGRTGQAPVIAVMMIIGSDGRTKMVIDDRATIATPKTEREALSRSVRRKVANQPGLQKTTVQAPQERD